MWKELVVVLIVIVTICSAKNADLENIGRGRNPFKHHHHHNGLYYLTHYWVFLAIKAKIIFLIGTFISFWVFAGKAFAFLYYVKNKENCKCPEYHHEKIVIPESPPFEQKYSTFFNSRPSIDYSGPSRVSFSPYRTIPPISTYEKYSRSIENSVLENTGFLKWIIKKVDLTELAFHAMNMKKKSCKKRFVCEADVEAKTNSLVAITLHMFSDVGLMKYRTNRTIESIEDCTKLGPYCSSES